MDIPIFIISLFLVVSLGACSNKGSSADQPANDTTRLIEFAVKKALDSSRLTDVSQVKAERKVITDNGHAMMTKKSYILSLEKEKRKQLEGLIEKYAVYSSNRAYGDIIIPRNNFVEFINALTNIGVVINSIDWWCNATPENKNKYGCPHGYGGPMTEMGWFSEMCHDSDDVCEIERDLFASLDTDFETETLKIINDKTIELIQNKRTITYADGAFLTFQSNFCLTPGFNLYVPYEWKRGTYDKSTNR